MDQFTPLDNVGKLFPAIRSDRVTSYFRLSVTLKEPIRKGVLQDAVDAVMTRYPYFQVGLRSGFFWYVLEAQPQPLQVLPDSTWPCMPLARRFRTPFLLRIRYYLKRIAVEFSHALTDGTGGLLFLQSLTAEYLEQRGLVVADWQGLPRPGEPIDPRELEDAFLPLYLKHYPKPPALGRAFQVPGPLSRYGVYHITTGILSAPELLALAKTYQVSLTEFLTAVYFSALQAVWEALPEKLRRRRSARLRIVVPVNLRKFFPSPTRRNFFLTVPLDIDSRLGRYSLAELCSKAHHFMRLELDEKFIRSHIRRNVGGERNPWSRFSPLFLKNLVLSGIFARSEAAITTSLSNLGRVDLPATLVPLVERFEFLPPPSPNTKVNAAVITWQDRVFVSFGRQISDPAVERAFFTTLRRLGLAVKIETN